MKCPKCGSEMEDNPVEGFASDRIFVFSLICPSCGYTHNLRDLNAGKICKTCGFEFNNDPEMTCSDCVFDENGHLISPLDWKEKCDHEMHNIGWYPDYFWQCRKCGHEEKVGAKSSSLEYPKNIALGYPKDAQMDEAVRRTKEKVGGEKP